MLHDVNVEHCPAVGVAVEFLDRVDVALPSSYVMPRYYREPIKAGGVAQIGPVTIKPGEPEFFDAVLLDLSRAFAIGQQFGTEGQ